MYSPFWQKHVYLYVFIGCGLFVLLTVTAMFIYPGGTYTDESTIGYNFFHNFFSALTTSGVGLIFFFIAFRQLFITNKTENWASLPGTIIGVASGLCFVGIACVPYDLNLDLHYQLVFWAFRTFLFAVGIYAYIIFRQDVYPRRYGWIFVIFAVFLAAYIVLLEFGPEAATPSGLVIQATGQKIIVYVSIVSTMAQSWAAYQFRSIRDQALKGT